MPRYIRLNPVQTVAATPSGGADDDLSTALRSLAPVGSLARAAGGLTSNPDLGAAGAGISGLIGLTRGVAGGNPGQAVGGAANLGSSLASLGGYPGVSSALGAVGGPLTLGTGLASGDPLSSTLGGLQTASLASGYLGGPTLSSLASAGLGAAGIDTAALAAMGGLSGLASAFALPAFMVSLGMIDSKGADLFDSLFGNWKSQAQRQTEEYKGYADEFPGLVQRKRAGAGLFDTLDEQPDLEAALRTAASGARANTEPAAWNLSHQPSATNIKPMDLSGWEAAMPELGGRAWGSTLGLMDRAQAAGLDAGGMTGTWNLDPVMRDGRPTEGANTTGEDYRTRLGHSGTEYVLLPDNTWGWGGPSDRPQTQEAQDLGNAVAGIGQHLGIDWKAKDPTGNYENFDPEQLAGYGFKPGAYGPAALNYLRSFDPSVTSNPEWERYVAALDPGNTLADLDPLTLTPRKKNIYEPLPQDLNLGGF